jgi:hypothetical protein
MVASAVIIELSANTPSPLNQVFRFMVLSSFLWKVFLIENWFVEIQLMKRVTERLLALSKISPWT